MGTMFRHAIGTVERLYAKQAQSMAYSPSEPALDPNVTSEYERVMGNFPHSQTDAILHSQTRWCLLCRRATIQLTLMTLRLCRR